jgi:uncharacterized protein (TIGR02680 family)
MARNTSEPHIDRWRIHRIGLINFWYYDEEEFLFEDGRLLLRGANGSGKSVTMQSFIPLLLDGNKDPVRLDPFGSRSRRLENYLLMEDAPQVDDNTGYLYMEFQKPASGHTLTIGMGLRARRNRPLDFWGFALTDGRRIGESFQLVKEAEGRLPLSKTELKNRIGDGGVWCESQREYMEMVNRRLFGFDQPDAFDGLIKLLIQIRTPKLSKDFKPTVITDILKNALQPLSDEDLRPMSEAIENMDGIKAQMDLLEAAGKAADAVQAEFLRYSRAVAAAKASRLLSASHEVEAADKEKSQWLQRLEDAQIRMTDNREKADALQHELDAATHRKEQLETHDSFRAQKELDELLQRIAEMNKQKTRKDQTVSEKNDRLRTLTMERREKATALESLDLALERHLVQMQEPADDLHFDEFRFLRAEMREKPNQRFPFHPVKTELNRLDARLGKGCMTLRAEKEVLRQVDMAEQSLDHARRTRDDSLRDADKAAIRLVEARDALSEEFAGWHGTLSEFHPDQAACQRIQRAIQQYGEEESASLDHIAEAVSESARPFEMALRHAAHDVQLEVKQVNSQLEENAKQLTHWKTVTDPEPIRRTEVEESRARLADAGIPSTPFFRAVEFCERVDDATRDAMEAALEDMGLLDALIVPENRRTEVIRSFPDLADRLFQPDLGFFRQDLSEWLRAISQPEDGVPGEDIDAAIRSIRMGDDTARASLDESGRFTLGVLQGRAKPRAARYLGMAARERYRQAEIARLEAERAQLEEMREKYEHQIGTLTERLAVLNGEVKSFQALSGRVPMIAAWNALLRVRQAVLQAESEVVRKEEEALQTQRRLREARQRVTEVTVGLPYPLTLEAWEQAADDARTLSRLLQELETLQERRLALLEQLASTDNQSEALETDLDELRHELSSLRFQLAELEDRRANLEAMLAEMGIEQIRAEIAICLETLRRIPPEREVCINANGRAESDLATAQRGLADMEPHIRTVRSLLALHAEGFHHELRLGLTPEAADAMHGDTAETSSESLLPPPGSRGQMELARRCQLAAAKERASLEELSRRLQESFHQQRGALAEFHPTLVTVFGEAGDGTEAERDIRLSWSRLMLQGRVQGRGLTWQALSEHLRAMSEQTRLLLVESDRQLFEDILANTVGRRIRTRIFEAEHWVDEMNALMERMNTSSGLSFSLSWKGRAAETEDQMDARELVELLKMDRELVSEERMAQLSRHFRSRILRARKRMEEGTGETGFHQVMREILDYREWFEFLLHCKKTGQAKRELTNNLFFSFSGGEKAMAMYVPLFSAVCARYAGARKDCPRLISLDEAFAGVDTNNVRDMFRLVVSLDLDFVMNSQALWGDCDTVPALSVYELLRPNNADYVTTIRYRWNGVVRELVQA